MITLNKRTKGLLLATVLAAGVGSAGVALAQGPIPVGGTMSVSPSTVDPGGTYVISNHPDSPCTAGEVSGDTGGIRPGAWFAVPDANGDWSVSIEVPANGPPDAMGNPTPFPEGAYEQHAFCGGVNVTAVAAAGQTSFNYEPVTVNVVAQEPPAPAPEPPAEPAVAPTAAAPTAAAPTFAG